MRTLASFPRLVAQLDAKKNGPIDPASVRYASGRRLWWRCPAGLDHLWAIRVATRTREGTGCPFCAGQAVSITNALSTVAPAIARQWHRKKNGALRPRDVTAGSHLYAWWKCPKGVDHEWRAAILQRFRGRGCPFCAGHRPSRTHNLAVTVPGVMREWHPTKNGTLRPKDVTPNSMRTIWWVCAHRHEWPAAARSRTRGSGCPFCSGRRVAPERSLAAVAPAVARQWHNTRNGALTPRNVTSGSGRRVWWKCPKGSDHEWRTTVTSRVAGAQACPFCSGHRVSLANSLAARFPKIAKQWHPTKNGRLTPEDVTYGSGRRAWWRCRYGHEWRGRVTNRTSSNACGCPFCAGQRVSSMNSLAVHHPKLAAEWHPTLNGKLTPDGVTRYSNRYAWWRCQFGHTWCAIIQSRSRNGANCPVCWRTRHKHPVATSRRKRIAVRFPTYEGERRGRVRRVR